MDERKDPMTGGGRQPGVERTVRQETEVRFGPNAPGERIHPESRFDRERYGVDREGHFESDSGRIRAGIDHTRSEIDETVAAIQDKLSPDRLMHRAMDMFSGGSGAGSRQALEIVRNNPVPAALIGLGIGWLALEKAGVFDRYGYSSGRRGVYRAQRGRGTDRDWLAPGAAYYPPGTNPADMRDERYDWDRGDEDTGPGMISRAREKAGGLAHSAREAIGGAGERMRSGADRVRSGASSVGEHARDWGASARDRAGRLGERTRETAQQARERIEESYDEYPLAMGGLALAGGLILGLILPPTRREDRAMGDYRDDLLDRAKDTGQDLYESGKRVAKTAAHAAREEAERENLTPGAVVRGVQRVAGRAAEAAEETATQEGERIKDKVTSGVGNAGDTSMRNPSQGQSLGQNKGPKPSDQSGPARP